MELDGAIGRIGGTKVAGDYLMGIVEGSEAARNAERSLRAAVMYMHGAGVKYGMAAVKPELYAQCAFMIVGDWTENIGNTAEGARAPLSVTSRQILLQLRYDKANRGIKDED